MGRYKAYDRGEVLKKAIKTFWEHGYENTSVRMLEDHMGINQKTIYSEFKSKENLFLEVLKQYLASNGKSILSPIINTKGDVGDIRTFFDEFVKNVQEGTLPNGCLLANTLMEYGSSNEDVKIELENYYHLIHGAFFNLLTMAKEKGNVPPETNIPQLANYLFACTEGLMVVVKILDKQALSDYIDVVMRSVK